MLLPLMTDQIDVTCFRIPFQIQYFVVGDEAMHYLEWQMAVLGPFHETFMNFVLFI